MILNAREKLCGRRWPPESPAVSDASSIAVLSTRLLLDLPPTASDTKQYEEQLVHSHLRMLYSVHQNQHVMVTGSSPEPLLAEASAEIMHHRIGTNENDRAYMDIWNLLGDFVDCGLAAQGTIGELIGRVLSISAMDSAIDTLGSVCELKYQTPVTVAAYYQAFLTNEAWETLRQSTPANCTRLSKDSATRTFEDAFADAYFHFSHYGKANDSSPMHDSYAWAYWLRGTAIICQLNQELTDRMTPIFFSKFRTVSPQAMSANLDQDKTGQATDPCIVGVQSVETLRIFSPGNKLPYIAAVHCYALTTDEGLTVAMPPTYDLRHPEKDEEAPRYQIDFRGLAAYRTINHANKITIRRMIDNAKNAVFYQHPQQYGVPLLRRMLPVLTGDPDSVAWCGGIGDTEAPIAGTSKGKKKKKGKGKEEPMLRSKGKAPAKS
jgi:hypothetical protein